MKNTKKWISVLLVAMLLISTVVATGVSVSAASGTLTHYYSTNGSGYGKEKTITFTTINALNDKTAYDETKPELDNFTIDEAF